MKTKETTQSTSVLNEALAAFRIEYRTRYITAKTAQLDRLAQALKENEWDRERVAPYPSAYQARKSYVQALKYHNWVCGVTEDLPLGEDPRDKKMDHGGWYRPYRNGNKGDTHTVKIKDGVRDRIAADAVKEADQSIDGYICKLAGKIEKEIASATYTGELWFGSMLRIVCSDGEVQNWKTRCILNCSCLGTIFNQWPTRRVK